MDNLENNTDKDLVNDDQATKSVADEVEQKGATDSVADDQESEFEVSGETQDSQNAVPVKKYAKLRNRAQNAESERDELKVTAKNLQERLDKLESKVNKKAMPTMESCDFEEEKYQAEMQAYYSDPKATKKQEDAPVHNQAAEQFLEDHYSRASSLPVSEERYEAAEGSFRKSMIDAFGKNGVNVAKEVLEEALDSSHLVAFALGDATRQRTLISKLKNDPTGYQAKLYIKNLASKASFKNKGGNVTTLPDVIPQGSSNSDSLKAQYDVAFKKWQGEPTIENHKKVRSLKKKL